MNEFWMAVTRIVYRVIFDGGSVKDLFLESFFKINLQPPYKERKQVSMRVRTNSTIGILTITSNTGFSNFATAACPAGTASSNMKKAIPNTAIFMNSTIAA
ncbi:MAG: hypothetical protein LBL91_02985 [Lachnospiraceae bacterium]|jgi:hypothetical protein|nr:hypothetical protein [Lachnospiraceae bacterium]